MLVVPAGAGMTGFRTITACVFSAIVNALMNWKWNEAPGASPSPDYFFAPGFLLGGRANDARISVSLESRAATLPLTLPSG